MKNIKFLKAWIAGERVECEIGGLWEVCRPAVESHWCIRFDDEDKYRIARPGRPFRIALFKDESVSDTRSFRMTPFDKLCSEWEKLEGFVKWIHEKNESFIYEY